MSQCGCGSLSVRTGTLSLLPFCTAVAHREVISVVLKAKHRSTLYEMLIPVVGDEEAVEDLLAQFPLRDQDEPITKDFLRAEIADIRTEIATVRTELQEQINAASNRMVTWLISLVAIGVTINAALLGVAVAILR